MQWAQKTARMAETAASLLNGDSQFEKECYLAVREHVAGLAAALKALDAKHEELDAMTGVLVRAEAARDKLLPLMAACRAHADALEGMVDDVMWPLPKYNEMLWQQ